MKKQFLTNTLLILVTMATQQLVGSQNQIVSPVIQLMNKINKKKRLPINPLDELKKLVEQKVDLNEVNPETGDTLLHHAVNHDHKEAAEFLLKNGALLLPNYDKETPFHRAAHQGNLGMCKLLVQYSTDLLKDINALSKFDLTPLTTATHNLAILTYFIEEKKIPVTTKNINGQTLLHSAVMFKAPEEVVAYLLNKGLNPNEQDKFGNTPLADLWFKDNSITLAKLLLNAGANLNQKNPQNGRTPFYSIADMIFLNDDPTLLPSCFNLLDFFIEKGATVDTEDIFQHTPLNGIAYNKPASIPVILYLLRKGADINHKDGNLGETPLMKAIRLNLPKIAQLFIEKGADWTITNDADQNALQAAETRCPQIMESLIAHAYAQHTEFSDIELPFKRPATKKILSAFVTIFKHGLTLPRRVQQNTLESIALKFILALTKGVPSEKFTLSPIEKELCEAYFTMRPIDFRITVLWQKEQQKEMKENLEAQAKLKKGFLHDLNINFNA